MIGILAGGVASAEEARPIGRVARFVYTRGGVQQWLVKGGHGQVVQRLNQSLAQGELKLAGQQARILGAVVRDRVGRGAENVVASVPARIAMFLGGAGLVVVSVGLNEAPLMARAPIAALGVGSMGTALTKQGRIVDGVMRDGRAIPEALLNTGLMTGGAFFLGLAGDVFSSGVQMFRSAPDLLHKVAGVGAGVFALIPGAVGGLFGGTGAAAVKDLATGKAGVVAE